MPSESKKIQAVTPCDIPHIVNLAAICGLSGWTKSDYEVIAGFPETIFSVIKDEGKCLGFLLGRVIADEFEIYQIAIRPDFRRCKLGSTILNYSLLKAIKLGAAVSFLEVRKSNVAALRLYASCNFEMVRQRKNYYLNPTEDAICLRKELDCYSVSKI